MTETLDSLIDAAQSGDGEDRYRLARHYLHIHEYGRARRGLGRAARAGHLPSLRELGKLCWKGLGQSPDPYQARECLLKASDQGDAESTYLLGRMDLPEKWSEATQRLAQSAEGGYPAAQRELGVLNLSANQTDNGMALLACASNSGDLLAAALLARLRNDTGLADFAAAQNLYIRQRFAPVGDAARADIKTPPHLDAPAEPHYRLPALSTEAPAASAEPVPGRIRVYDNVLTEDECEYLIELVAPDLRPSHTVHPQTGEPIRNQMRTSYGFSLHSTDEDFVVHWIKRKLALRANVPVSHAEPFALLRYENGQEYKEHFDFINPDSGEAGAEIGRRGQRQVTAFSYLTTVAAGGATHFPKHAVKVTPKQGRALVFNNLLESGEPDLDSLHASLPVESGEKWIATLWFRTRDLHR